MKKLSTLLLALPLAALAGCSSSGPGGSGLFPGGGDGNGADAASDSTILMSQAVMGMDLLGSGSPSTTPLRRAKAAKNVQATDEATLANEILDYIEDFDSILGYEPGQIEQLTSDDANYEYLLSLNLEGEEYRLYFNKVASHIEVDDDDDWEKETEETYIFSGLAYKGETTYDFRGSYTIETEGRETESEVEFTFLTDKANYVTFTQEKENDENEYELELVQNGRTVLEKEFEIEVGRYGTVEVSFEIEQDGREREIEIIKMERDGAITYLIEIDERDETYAKAEIVDRDGVRTIVLTFVNGGTYERALA